MPAQLDERPQVDALRAQIDAAFGTGTAARAYDVGTVPGADGNKGDLPNLYATVQLERRGAATGRRSGGVSVTAWRVTVLGAGRSATEARWVLLRVSQALDGQVVHLADGAHSTPLQHESSRGVAKDATRFTGTRTYTYAL